MKSVKKDLFAPSERVLYYNKVTLHRKRDRGMTEWHDIEQMLSRGETEAAVARLDTLLASPASDDRLYYLRGKARFKQNRWQQALEDFMEAVRLNPASPAAEALEMTYEILEFYNKDIYGQ